MHRRSGVRFLEDPVPHVEGGRARRAAPVPDRRADPRCRPRPTGTSTQRPGETARRRAFRSPLRTCGASPSPTPCHRSVEGNYARACGCIRRAVGIRARLDGIVREFEAAPESLTNAILAGTLLFPVGLAGRRGGGGRSWNGASSWASCRSRAGTWSVCIKILMSQSRLLDIQAPQRAQRRIAPQEHVREALTWLEIHGERPDVVGALAYRSGRGSGAAAARLRRRVGAVATAAPQAASATALAVRVGAGNRPSLAAPS